jgi:hypothetical protein
MAPKELEKATIGVYIGTKRDPITVLFNPTEYQLNQSNQFSEVSIPGLAAPPLQFARGNARTLSMQLFFDTYEQRTDVRVYTRALTELLELDSELHAPPICQFTWGKLIFIGVLEHANQRYTLFLSDGTPVRATVDVSFKEFWDTDMHGGRLQSANFAKHHTISRGETLSSIAAHYYGDPAKWRPIAEENQIDDPLALRPGQVLSVPPIE